MMTLLLPVVVLGAAWLLHARHAERARAVELADLAEQVRALAARVDAAEADAAAACAHTDAAETLLVEKGIADEEELAAARRRAGDEDAAYDRARDGELH